MALFHSFANLLIVWLNWIITSASAFSLGDSVILVEGYKE